MVATIPDAEGIGQARFKIDAPSEGDLSESGMIQFDMMGNPTTANGPEAMAALDRALVDFYAHARSTPDSVAAALEADSTLPLAHMMRGYFLMLMARPELVPQARQALATARWALTERGGTDREWAYLSALSNLTKGRMREAANKLDRLLDDRPNDLLAAKLVHALRFMLGDATGMRASIEQVLVANGPETPLWGYLMGCRAFAAEETGDCALAEHSGRAAVEAAPLDAWGRHAVAHALEMTGRVDEGARWLEGREDTWAHCNNFGEHLHWHLALFLLEQDRLDEVVALYDRSVRANPTDDYRDIANGASLLMRLELRGVDVGARWQEMADKASRRVADGCLVFADLHYLLALMGADRVTECDALTYQVSRRARRGATCQDFVSRQAGLAASDAMRAYGTRDFDQAVKLFCEARPLLQRVGGSHAQRDVFEQLLIDAAVRSGRHRLATHLLDERETARGSHPFATHMRARMADLAKTLPEVDGDHADLSPRLN